MQDLKKLLKLLTHSSIEFVVVGGFAAVLHGSNQTTRDIDICILYDSDQMQALREMLAPLHPYHRMNETRESFLDTPKDLSKKQDFHLMTDWGALDVIHHIEGVGSYWDVLKNSCELELYGGKCHVISLDDLIKSKRTLGRHRDIVVAMELEAIREEKQVK